MTKVDKVDFELMGSSLDGPLPRRSQLGSLNSNFINWQNRSRFA